MKKHTYQCMLFTKLQLLDLILKKYLKKYQILTIVVFSNPNDSQFEHMADHNCVLIISNCNLLNSMNQTVFKRTTSINLKFVKMHMQKTWPKITFIPTLAKQGNTSMLLLKYENHTQYYLQITGKVQIPTITKNAINIIVQYYNNVFSGVYKKVFVHVQMLHSFNVIVQSHTGNFWVLQVLVHTNLF
eukprot:TRINITY_DN14817_c0_g2_i2.p1 TRINITY_DN14817_c0_g2~~TRINITY_DN14817_c0_g2_i2.p1  ORF type:complete len:187 (-),score=-20.00 TRINITY_DN14817_c0_g2_i2:433-993(-)